MGQESKKIDNGEIRCVYVRNPDLTEATHLVANTIESEATIFCIRRNNYTNKLTNTIFTPSDFPPEDWFTHSRELLLNVVATEDSTVTVAVFSS